MNTKLEKAEISLILEKKENNQQNMLLAAAQTNPLRENTAQNLDNHCHIIEKASDLGVDLIVFPEMSLTGYEREKAREQAYHMGDMRLKKLWNLSVDRNIVIIAGAPVVVGNDVYIAAFIFQPTGQFAIYTKQYLHEGEAPFFNSSFYYCPEIELGDDKLSVAICADIEHAKHIESAKNAGNSIYLASMFYTPQSMEKACEKLGYYAKNYDMDILMANYCGKSWELEAGGKSAFWNKKGEPVAQLDGQRTGLLLVEKNQQDWTAKMIYDE